MKKIKTFENFLNSINVIDKYSNEYPEYSIFLHEFIKKFPNKSLYDEKLKEYEEEYEDDPDEGVPEVYMLENEIDTELPDDISEIWLDFFNDLCETNWCK